MKDRNFERYFASLLLFYHGCSRQSTDTSSSQALWARSKHLLWPFPPLPPPLRLLQPRFSWPKRTHVSHRFQTASFSFQRLTAYRLVSLTRESPRDPPTRPLPLCLLPLPVRAERGSSALIPQPVERRAASRKRTTTAPGRNRARVRRILGTCKRPLIHNTGPGRSPHVPELPRRDKSPGVPVPTGGAASAPVAAADRSPLSCGWLPMQRIKTRVPRRVQDLAKRLVLTAQEDRALLIPRKDFRQHLSPIGHVTPEGRRLG
jgi:hypothetical protein